MTTGKTIALTRWTFVDKVMSLLFIILSMLVITSLPRSKRLLISWLQSPSAVILKPKKIKSVTVSIVESFGSVQFSRSVVSDSLRPHESQQARSPCSSPTPRVYSNSCPSSVMPSSHLILCHPLPLLPPIPPSIRVFSNQSTLMRWPKYWSFSISPSNEHPDLSPLG